MWWMITGLALAMTPAEQASDLAEVRALLGLHPSLDAYVSEEALDRAFAAAVSGEDVEVHRFYARLMSLLALLGDGHTDAVMDGPALDAFLGDRRFLPYDAVVFEDGLYLDPRFHAPARIVSIDGRAGEEIVATLRQRLVADGPVPSARDGDIDLFFANLYAQTWGFSDAYEVVLDPGAPEVLSVSGVAHPEVPYVGEPGPNRVSLTDGLLWITLNEPEPSPTWRGFWKALRRGLREADAVVLDLRTCGGGFGLTMDELLDLFALEERSYRVERVVSATLIAQQPDGPYAIVYAPDETGTYRTRPALVDTMEGVEVSPWRHAWTDRLVLVTGPQTFSACSDLAAALVAIRDDAETVVVGSETRGGARRLNAAQFEQRVLPASGIFVQVPLVQMTAPASFGELGRGVVPDLEMEDRPDTVEDEVADCARRLSRGETCAAPPPRPPWIP
jgi:hypothetical protein